MNNKKNKEIFHFCARINISCMIIGAMFLVILVQNGGEDVFVLWTELGRKYERDDLGLVGNNWSTGYGLRN